MEDSDEPPDSRIILKDSLEKTVKDYNKLSDWGNKFIKDNPTINNGNKEEYDALYWKLGSFYKTVVYLSNLDLNSSSMQQRFFHLGNKEFAEKIKIPLSILLIKLVELKQPEEESPFYEPL